MKLTLQTPVKLYVDDLEPLRLSEIRNSLTYTDKKVQYELRKHKNNRWLQNSNPERWQEKLADLQARVKVCLLNQDADGRFWCLGGMTDYLEKKYGIKAEVLFDQPEGRSLAWVSVPDRTPYPYQLQAKENLQKALRARVEMGTGLGKSFIILNLVRELGLRTVLMAPSTSIADQLYQEFVKHLGKKNVGAYYDGKKDFKKLITIGNAQSMTRIEPDSEAGKAFASAQVFIADESHQCPAATLSKVCTGICSNAPYRYFFSATQMRTDGLDLLLDAITGPTVYEMTVREGVDQGYLAKPHFIMVEVESNGSWLDEDANEMTRHHLFYNPEVNASAAKIANMAVSAHGHQVLILIDEVEQFSKLQPFLAHRAEFAHGALQSCICQKVSNEEFMSKHKGKHTGNACKVPREFHDSDPNEQVGRFNKGEFSILVGTSCIATGTDIRNNKTMIYLRGGKSEIEVRQGVGRCTRKEKSIEKTACMVWDFIVNGPDGMEKRWVVGAHSMERMAIYNDIYGPTQVLGNR